MFGKKIKKLRSALELSQTQLATILGKSQTVISHYENDLHSPNKETIVKLEKLTAKYDLNIKWKK